MIQNDIKWIDVDCSVLQSRMIDSDILYAKTLAFPRKEGSDGSVMFRREVQCTPAAKTVRSFAGMLRLARRLYLALQIYHICIIYIHSSIYI